MWNAVSLKQCTTCNARIVACKNGNICICEDVYIHIGKDGNMVIYKDDYIHLCKDGYTRTTTYTYARIAIFDNRHMQGVAILDNRDSESGNI